MTFGTRARIRLGAIQHNFQALKSLVPGARTMAVVKANAYGHGLVPVARALSEADSLAVARLAEARQLRDAGVQTDITLLGGVLSADDLALAMDLGVTVTFHHQQHIEWAERFSGRIPLAWLKVDTGMGRLGFQPGDAAAALTRLRDQVDRLGMLTHFASADEPELPTTREQLAAFTRLVDGFDGEVSIANSAALLGWQESLAIFDTEREQGRLWIRPGLSLYGISPCAGKVGQELGLRPAMQLEATLLSAKAITTGDRVGYGGTWQAQRDTVLGIIAGGYGDGYSRFIASGSPVLVNGRRVPVAGRISMDLTAVDLGPGAKDVVGDPVIFWGDGLPVEKIAECAGTIPYQLVCGVTHREAAVYE